MYKLKAHASVVRLPGSVAARLCFAVLITLFIVLLLAPARLVAPAKAASQVHALFDLSTPAGGPFPSNVFTVPDPTQNTGLRVDMPKPDCTVRPSDCEDLDLINTLDGFNLRPRVAISFDGPIDLTTVTGESIFLISLGNTLPDGGHRGDDGNRDDNDRRDDDEDDGDNDNDDDNSRIVGINRVVWDPLTNALHVESDELLDQHTRYALIVTNRLRDSGGRPIEASQAFRRFRHDIREDYKHELLDAIHAARRVGVRESDIVTASVFTTLSATANLEKMRDQIKAATPTPADFNLGTDGTRKVFALDEVTGITFNQQTGDNPARLTAVALNLSLLRLIPGALGRVAF